MLYILCYIMLSYVLYSHRMYILFLVPHLYQPVDEMVTIVNKNNNNNDLQTCFHKLYPNRREDMEKHQA